MEDGWGTESASSLSRRHDRRLECVECGTISDPEAIAWRGYRIDDPNEDELPALAFYCPSCAHREFD
jgi:hypothetical protein